MIFLELTDSNDNQILLNPSSISYIADRGKCACIVLKNGDSINTQSDYEAIKTTIKRALRRSS